MSTSSHQPTLVIETPADLARASERPEAFEHSPELDRLVTLIEAASGYSDHELRQRLVRSCLHEAIRVGERQQYERERLQREAELTRLARLLGLACV